MSIALTIGLILVAIARLACGTEHNLADLSPLGLTKFAGHVLLGGAVVWWHEKRDANVGLALWVASTVELIMWLANPEVRH